MLVIAKCLGEKDRLNSLSLAAVTLMITYLIWSGIVCRIHLRLDNRSFKKFHNNNKLWTEMPNLAYHVENDTFFCVGLNSETLMACVCVWREPPSIFQCLNWMNRDLFTFAIEHMFLLCCLTDSTSIVPLLIWFCIIFQSMLFFYSS